MCSFIRTYIYMFVCPSLVSISGHLHQSCCIKLFKTVYYKGLLMDLVYVLPIATCCSKILHSILTPQFMSLGRAEYNVDYHSYVMVSYST